MSMIHEVLRTLSILKPFMSSTKIPCHVTQVELLVTTIDAFVLLSPVDGIKVHASAFTHGPL
jgi:hypothetical protein